MNNPLYHFSLIHRYARSIGWSAAIRLRFCDFEVRTGIARSSLVELDLKNSEYPILMRVGSSDREVLGQVFIEQEYDPIVLSRPQVILDLGANVGYSSAYFLSKYPTASVVAVEPDPSNYAICSRNLISFGKRAKVVLGAAWPECAKLVLDRGTWKDGREWTTQAKADSPQNKVSVHVHYGSNCSGELLPPFDASRFKTIGPFCSNRYPAIRRQSGIGATSREETLLPTVIWKYAAFR